MYERTIKLNHNEVVAKVNKETGEVTAVPSRNSNIPEDREIFEPSAYFRKDFTNSWKFLNKVLTPLEFKVAYTLALMAKATTNSLEPLNDDSTIPELMGALNISKNKVKPILEKLYRLGVYGKFSVAKIDKPYTKYWIYNPYLSFSGKIIDSSISSLFKNTHCSAAFRDPQYYLKYKLQ